MAAHSPILAPVVALVLWSVAMWVWMYATRIPAIRRLPPGEIDASIPGRAMMEKLPPRVRWKADNYNHLMEQPTVFYATTLTLALLGAGEAINLWLAWTYVGLRVAHSLFQALVNVIPVRFLIYVVGNVPLVWLAVNAALIVF